MSAPLTVSLAELKAYLRIDGADDDALLAGLVRTASALCEAFTGQVLIAERRSVDIAASNAWQRLTPTPARSVESAWLAADGGGETAAEFESQVDMCGDAWVRIKNPPGGEHGRVRVEVDAGIADDWNGVPEALRQGIMRLAAHLYTHRDAADDAGPPSAVAALWRPWRRMRLS